MGGIVAALARASQQNSELGYDSDVGASKLDQHSGTPSMDHGGFRVRFRLSGSVRVSCLGCPRP